MPRKRRIFSVKEELLTKSREAMLSAVQTFNNPSIQFKSETFIVLANIAWTYLLHAYFRSKKIDYRYFKESWTRKKYDRTKRGAYKYWELERCLNDDACPISAVPKENLRFLIGLRHEIEHQMTSRIDEYLSARFQACCLNYNFYIRELFGDKYGIDKHLSFSLQFSSISEDQIEQVREFSELPKHIAAYINDFDRELSQEDFNNPQYSYRVIYVPKIANHKGQADKVIEFLKADSEEAKNLNKEYVVIKDRERPKHLPKEIIQIMKDKGYPQFTMNKHTDLWHARDAKNPTKGFGVQVVSQWYWYDNWLDEVEKYCKENKALLQ